ncbi:DUF418 domain-containing protein [Spirosoma sp. HMF4905]|uniref:DUF418 domain-containing protein n=1 Tax=Spirosoma arboris TaxID=2682092 RepID=A0A7K1S5Z0_9BACT|nr:DUF418 domain-containing protein [Spirosoma arboris]MVM29038.1 DUF418 domain-containing protein [Spirosoma arboris]
METYTSLSGLPEAIATGNTTDYQDSGKLSTPRPVAKANRIQTIDLIRGFALLGILLMNIPGFGLGMLFSTFYEFVRRGAGPDFYTWTVVSTGFSGTMRGLFSMLFGAGMLLFTINKSADTDATTVAGYYYRRLLWLILFGVFNAYILLWDGDILFQYGLCGLVLYVFRRAKPIWLIGLALLCVGINLIRPAVSYSEIRANRASYLEAIQLEKAHQKPSEKQTAAKAAWEKYTKSFQKDARQEAEELKAMRGTYSTAFVHRIPENSFYESNFVYFNSWDCLLMMFLGMALLKWGFFSNQLPTSTYALTLLVGYGLGLPISWVYVQGRIDLLQHIDVFVDSYRVNPAQVYDLRRILLALGHASLLILVYRANIVPWLMKALTAVGQMAFTNYLMQSIICTLFFNGYGLGYFGKLAYHELFYLVAGVWLFQLIASPIWLHYFRFGPFEWLWRSLTYWQAQPMRRVSTRF